MENGESQTRRRSVRTPKRKDAGIEQAEFPPNKKPFRKCEKAGCPSSRPSCFSKATAGCARDGYTSRWYHISNREHFCNECFDYFYRSNKDGNARYTDWKLKSAANCQKELTLKLFFAEEILGYWVNCAACKKWRAVPDSVVENGVIDPFWSCGKADELKCSDPESEFVTEAKSMSWLNTLTYTPLIKFDSPFSTLKEYYSDGIGFSTLSTKQEAADDDEEKKDFIQPFYSPSDAQKAGSCNPDIMQADEKEAFPELSRQAPWIYLGIRNVVLSLWNTNVKEFHTLEKCMAYINVRGLARITMAEILKDILDFLTLRGRINFGIMENVPSTNFLHGDYFKGSVVVIGAGVSGISSANQLQRAGCKVQILEAREDIGGRIKDDNSLGVLVSQGPQIITGYINNPFTIMSEQTDSTLRILRPRCNLLDSQGTIADEEIDQKVEFYFNLMLESLEELKAEDDGKCLSLKDSFEARKKDLEAQIYRELTEEEHHLLEFHLANLEYACGASLEKISAFHWNQNEAILQYSGDHAWVKSGFKTILNKLSLGLNIRLGYVVSSIDYSGSQVKIECSNGKEFFADKVILTVPLSMLKREKIKFNPKLPDDKSLAISHLGAGCIEKVVMKFKNNFWTDKIGNADYFGRIPDSSEGRGFSCLFYDVSDKTNYILLALIAGDSVQEIKEMPEQEIVSRCVETLAKFFPEKKVPKPSKYFVSRWSKEEHIEMTYSYVGLEGNGDDYDQMAKQIDDKIYFAGEATNRGFPQTVTGAFLSGLREARKILTSS